MPNDMDMLISEKLTFLETLIFTLNTRSNICFPASFEGICIVLGTVAEKAGLTYSLTKLRLVD